jgi:hypothetical protein
LLEGEAGLHSTWVGRISIRNHTTRSFRSFEESEISSARRLSSRWRNVTHRNVSIKVVESVEQLGLPDGPPWRLEAVDDNMANVGGEVKATNSDDDARPKHVVQLNAHEKIDKSDDQRAFA